MCRTLRSFAGDTRGATVVEFSLVVIPMLLVLFGTIEFGRLMWTREALQSVANSGARCMGIVQTSCGTSGVYSSDKTSAYVIAQATTMRIPLTSSNITLTQSTTCAGVSGFAKVSISYTFETAVPQLLGSLAAGIPVTASACFPNQT